MYYTTGDYEIFPSAISTSRFFGHDNIVDRGLDYFYNDHSSLEQNLLCADDAYREQMQRVIYSIRLVTPDVVNQKRENNCQLYTYDETLGTVFTMWFYKIVVILLQVMIDNGINDVYDALTSL